MMTDAEYDEYCFDMEFWAEELVRTPFDWLSLEDEYYENAEFYEFRDALASLTSPR